MLGRCAEQFLKQAEVAQIDVQIQVEQPRLAGLRNRAVVRAGHALDEKTVVVQVQHEIPVEVRRQGGRPLEFVGPHIDDRGVAEARIGDAQVFRETRITVDIGGGDGLYAAVRERIDVGRVVSRIITRRTHGQAKVSEVVVTVTPSESPLVRNEWIKEGTHISAMGADIKGKHELDTTILKRASLFADYPKQSIMIGEFQHAYNDGLINSVDDICALGLVTLGKSPGRQSDAEITVFDSSGIAIQDLAVAGAIFEAAQQMNEIQYIDY